MVKWAISETAWLYRNGSLIKTMLLEVLCRLAHRWSEEMFTVYSLLEHSNELSRLILYYPNILKWPPWNNHYPRLRNIASGIGLSCSRPSLQTANKARGPVGPRAWLSCLQTFWNQHRSGGKVCNWHKMHSKWPKFYNYPPLSADIQLSRKMRTL